MKSSTRLKIGFVGSHGTGKSSAACHLSSLLKRTYPKKNVGTIHENVREIAKLVDNNVNSEYFQKLCMVDHLHRELMYETMYDVIICDRTTIDSLVYGLVHKVKTPSEYYSLALSHLNTFNQVFFVRPDSNDLDVLDDGFRDTDKKIRNKVDERFEEMLYLWGGNFTELRSSDIYTYDYLEKCNEI